LKKINKKSGTLFWITGLPGSGKTSIAKNIHKSIEKKYGKTIEISGDDLRKLFLFNKYDLKNRKIYAKQYSKFCKFLVDRKLNVIFSTVSLFHDVQKWNREHISNYYEIFVRSNLKKIIKLNKKKIYKKKTNLIGINLDAQFPKKPDLKINNNFNYDIKLLSQKILNYIIKNYK